MTPSLLNVSCITRLLHVRTFVVVIDVLTWGVTRPISEKPRPKNCTRNKISVWFLPSFLLFIYFQPVLQFSSLRLALYTFPKNETRKMSEKQSKVIAFSKAAKKRNWKKSFPFNIRSKSYPILASETRTPFFLSFPQSRPLRSLSSMVDKKEMPSVSFGSRWDSLVHSKCMRMFNMKKKPYSTYLRAMRPR